MYLRSGLQRHLVADAHDIKLFGKRVDANAELANICPIQAIDAIRAEDTLLLHRHDGKALAPRRRQQTRTVPRGSARNRTVYARRGGSTDV